MNSLYQKAFSQSGQELLSGNLEPTCYASVMTEAAGDASKAMGLYAERRAAVIYADLLRLEGDGQRRLMAMSLERPRIRRRETENDLFRPLLLMLAIFLGSTSVLLYFCSSVHGEICPQILRKICMTSLSLVGLGLLTAILIRLKLPRMSFAAAMMPFAIALSLCSLGSASYMVKKRQQVAWSEGERTVGESKNFDTEIAFVTTK